MTNTPTHTQSAQRVCAQGVMLTRKCLMRAWQASTSSRLGEREIQEVASERDESVQVICRRFGSRCTQLAEHSGSITAQEQVRLADALLAQTQAYAEQAEEAAQARQALEASVQAARRDGEQELALVQARQVALGREHVQVHALL